MSDDRSTRADAAPPAHSLPVAVVRRRWWWIAIVGLLAVSVDLVVWQALRIREDRVTLARFEYEADERVESIRVEFVRDFEALMAVCALFASTDSVDRVEFHTFVAPLLEHSHGLAAVEWITRVPLERREEFEKALREQTGAVGIRCRDASEKRIPCGSRAQYFPVNYVEPLDSNKAVLGVDYSGEPRKWQAMQRSAETGFWATPWMDLTRLGASSGANQKGVFIFMPTYGKSAPTAEAKPGRGPLIGYVSGVVRIADVVESGMRGHPFLGLDLALFDGPECRAETPHLVRYSTYRYQPPDSKSAPWEPPPEGIRYSHLLDVAGHPWLVVCTPTDRYLAEHHTWVPLVSLVTGLVLAGLLTAFVAALLDQTWRVERRVTRRTAELKRSNEQLEAFAYAASHDLQEPLRAVAGYCQLLSRRYHGKLDEDADEFIQFAVQGAVRMQDLINDLLEYSRVSTRGTPFVPTDLNQVLCEVRENLEIAIAESGAMLTSDPLPTVLADATQMSQLLQNLVGNAIKYRQAQLPVIQISAEERPNDWLLRVRDNGIGVDPRYAQRIFAIFQRLHTREEYPGTGIGLAICKKIVERHGGRIWVESEPGQGATFLFTLLKRHEVEP